MPPYMINSSPEEDYRPATPGWLVERAQLGETGVGDKAVQQLYPPAVSRALDELQRTGREKPLGEESTLQDLFLLGTSSGERGHFLNTGRYGAAYRLAVDAQRWYQEKAEMDLDYYYQELGPLLLQDAKACVARYIGVRERDLVHVTNASTAVNTVLHSLRLAPGDLLLITSITYPAVKSAAARWAARAGAGLLTVTLDLPTILSGAAAILRRFQAALADHGGRVRLAILDHISSAPAFRLPVADIASACKQHGIRVLVDGAHAVGAIPLEVATLGVDYYTSNLHKWGGSPKSAAFLWVEQSSQSSLLPLVTSHGYGTGFQGEFAWQGTTDISAWLAAPVALRVQEALGTDRVRSHNWQMLRQAVGLLLDAWGSELCVLGATDPFSHMASVELPRLPTYQVSAKGAEELCRDLECRHAVHVPICAWEGRLWVRISAQVFNTRTDYEALRDAICAWSAQDNDPTSQQGPR